MDYNRYSWILLCEDKAHYHFVRGWLKKHGVRNINSYGELPIPDCAKAYVLREFTSALKKIRAMTSYRKVALVVLIDADDKSTQQILSKMPIQADDIVFFVIPKWSIETWIRFINDKDDPDALDETVSCRAAYHDNTSFGKVGSLLATWPYNDFMEGPKSMQDCVRNIKDKKEVLGL